MENLQHIVQVKCVRGLFTPFPLTKGDAADSRFLRNDILGAALFFTGLFQQIGDTFVESSFYFVFSLHSRV